MASVNATSGSSGGTQLDSLVESYLQTRQPELDVMQNKKSALETKKVFYSNLRNRISSVTSQLDKFYKLNNSGAFDTNFKTTADKLLNAKKVSSSDDTFIKATAESSATVGPNSIRVNRLATNDSFVSKRINLSDTLDIPKGQIKYSISVKNKDAKETDSADKKIKNVDILINFEENETQESALKKISNAINAKSDLNFSASFMKDTNSTGRLVLTAKNSGEENQIDLSFLSNSKNKNDVISNLLGIDNINDNRTAKASTNSDAKFRVADTASLDSELTVNGIQVTRSSNSIEDLLPGVTLNILKVNATEDRDISITTEIDSNKVITNISNAMDSYNELVKLLKNDKTMLRSDSALSGLLSQMRGLITTFIDPLVPDAEDAETEEKSPKFITDMGFKIQSDGTITISDKTIIEKMLATDGGSDRISHFFNSENGFFSKLSSIVDNVIKDDGLIDVRNESFNRQLEYNKTRTSELQIRIDKASESMRKQYTALLDAYNKANNQYTALGSLMQSSSSSYY